MKFEELPKPIDVGKTENLIGNRYGDLVVLFRAESVSGRPQWACRCDCGAYCIRRSDGLKSDNYSFCGLPEHSSQKLVGQKRGHLVVAKRTDEYNRNDGWRYICYCDCGNPEPILMWGKSLAYDRNQSCKCAKTCYRNEISGMRFGLLLAIEPSRKSFGSSRSIYWKCQCDCGNVCYKEGTSLLSGHVTSCGCRNTSIGEDNIMTILDDAKIPYEHNKMFDICRFPDTNKHAVFDFYVDQKFLLEFDGEQHIDVDSTFFGVQDHYRKIHRRDLYKNQWAYNMGIPIKRIPYYMRDRLNIERIMSDEFLITPETHSEWYPSAGMEYPYGFGDTTTDTTESKTVTVT